ncbi:M23 family metallopeptidase [Thermovibrio ammonificans]|jgi:murein DD-endopeptidase MepM/ murein hydrolase activator NlpD
MLRVLFLLLFLASAAVAKTSASLYLPYRYPGSLGYFKVNPKAPYKVVVSGAGRSWVFKGVEGSSKVYFVVPYGLKGRFKLSLYRGRREVFSRVLRVSPKRFRVSRIWVKTRPLKGALLRRVIRENRLLRRIFSQVTPKKFRSSKLHPPLPRLVVSTPFGAKRIINGKKRSIHWGTDFRAKRGTPVYAALSGRVVLARKLYFTGNTVVIDHGLGIHTLYAHLSRITVKEGQFVKRGQVVGRVGSTGRSTGPHLHFGFYVDDVKADPMLVLKERL